MSRKRKSAAKCSDRPKKTKCPKLEPSSLTATSSALPVDHEAVSSTCPTHHADTVGVSEGCHHTDSTFVQLPWFMDTVYSVALCIDRDEVPLICGPVGCGKTAAIDHLAKIRSAQTFKMQISDQTDAKSLLGAYCCSETPGVFVWRPGPLTHCMSSGKWLILEDVDRGSADLPIILSPVLRKVKDSSLRVFDPNTGEPVNRHPAFRLILTRRTVSPYVFSQQTRESEIYSTNCYIIYMGDMPTEVIENIIHVQIPSFLPLAKRLLSEFSLLNYFSDYNSQERRFVCSRDFFKFFTRAAKIGDTVDVSLRLYLDALDCFVCSQPPGRSRDEIAIQLGGVFNFTRENAAKIWHSRKPSLCINRDITHIEAGRAVLPIKKSIHWELQFSKSSGQTFADTRLACALVERLAVAVEHAEPVLLVGETGIGKTAAVQRLALMAGRRLRVLNLNQQSDSVDLLGGFKPVDSRALINPVRDKFEGLFARTFRLDSNRQFLGHIQTCAKSGRWRDMLTFLKHPARVAIRKISASSKGGGSDNQKATVDEWQSLLSELDALEKRLSINSSSSLAFAFIEGALVRALEDGDWVLLDEINLAPGELLDCLAGLLDSAHGSVTLIDRGDLEPVKRHPDFHLFAAMNPSTDVGKRDLPTGLRNRFTEIHVAELEPTTSTVDQEDLVLLVRTYLSSLGPSAAQVSAIVHLYSALKKAAFDGLIDGVGQRPCFSLRTLCRALTESSRGYHGSFLRSLYEGFLFSFGSQVGRSSRPLLERLIQSHLLATLPRSSTSKNDIEVLSRQIFSKPLPPPPLPDSNSGFICVEGYWIPEGPLEKLHERDNAKQNLYVLTDTVRGNLRDLARVVSAAGSLPVLLQGETSVGKTSLITYLAARVGQICHRINNHEHTDLQTYLGSYTAGSASSACNVEKNSPIPLVFQEGIFVKAMKHGHWIILDELNLAPTEILEALNRVLDENRELFITETQEMVRAHPHFRVFATQNPPGLYAGRKMLSRALRNRFVELHFDPLPCAELEVILEHRSALPRSRAAKMVEVMHQLQLLRRASDIFQGKDGFITLRDLFRWGERYRLATCKEGENRLFDWDAYLAEQGYLLLAGRARNTDEARAVADIIQQVFKKQIIEKNLFDIHTNTSAVAMEFLSVVDRPLGPDFDHVVWTRDMRRLAVLVGNALKYNEPILLVGETGCGKTTICQIFAALRQQTLHCVNCHQYTEAADFLGGLRPVRASNSDVNGGNDDRLFEWVDGPLVTAMLCGESFLLDEISLADDAVLERLNSLLEPERRLCLAERCGGGGGDGVNSSYEEEISAAPDFRLFATMNPGGDYAKKELSPALRNRFTEIWCPSANFLFGQSSKPQEERVESEEEDWRAIVLHNLQRSQLSNSALSLKSLAASVVDFCRWFTRGRNEVIRISGLMRNRQCKRPPPTIRDLLAWVEFIHNIVYSRHDFSRAGIFNACLHGAALIFLDSLDDDSGTQEWEYLATMENIQNVVNAQFEFNLVGGVKYLLHCFFTHFDAQREGEDSRLGVTEDISKAVAAFITTLGLRPGQCVLELTKSDGLYGCKPFFIEKGTEMLVSCPANNKALPGFSLSASTPALNLCRLLRALQLPRRALLLEGSPGVGKTSLVVALARASGHRVVRINLSEATEASDLFGCDLPVEGASCGTFAWRDGPLLQALRYGHWILLDEMNLASQSVLECLNACLDHRGAIYIPELGKTFHLKPRATRLFACQNPVEEGGGRKALPKSFLNRFTQVYLKPLTPPDQIAVLTSIFSNISVSHITAMVRFNSILQEAVERGDVFTAMSGISWEFNLRDLLRWGDLLTAGESTFGLNPGLYVYLLYASRMRSNDDKSKVAQLWNSLAEHTGLGSCYIPRGCTYPPKSGKLQIGLSTWPVDDAAPCIDDCGLLILNYHRPYLEMLLKILQHGWMCIVIGPRGAGKRSLVHLAAFLTHRPIATVALSPSADTVELLGAFEQRENGGVFEWVDSPLVRGIKEGHWVMLENAQLCSPSVLDRLNSLLEPEGEILISERGLDANGNLIRLSPHPDFRLVLIVDESSVWNCNNISRAMRNRGIEIVLTHDLTIAKEDLRRLLLNTGLSPDMVTALLVFEDSALQRLHTTSTTLLLHKPPLGALLSAARMIKQLLSSNDTAQFVPAIDDRFEGTEAMEWMNKYRGDSNKLAFAKALIDIYARRHMDRKVKELYIKAIYEFVDSELQTLLTSTQNTFDSRLNRANELFTFKSLPLDQWRNIISRVLAMSPPDSYGNFKLLIIRFSTERGFITVSSSATHAQSVDECIAAISNPVSFDARWIPGWRCMDDISAQNITYWNSRIIDAFLYQFNAVRAKIFTNSDSLTFNETMPVICALDHGVKGNLPVTFSEAYPGLAELQKQFVMSFNYLQDFSRFQSHETFDFYDFLSAFAKINAWLQQFGSQPIGAHSDWVDRKEFFNSYCRSFLGGEPEKRLRNLVHRYLPAPIPRMPCPINGLNHCHLPWARLALEAQDQIYARLNGVDNELNEETNVNMSNTIAPEASETMRLWPVLAAGLVFGRSDADLMINDGVWPQSLSRYLVVDLGLHLGALSRPRLLEMLASVSVEASEHLTKILLANRTYSSLELAEPAGLMKPDLLYAWQSLSQAVLAVNHANSPKPHCGAAACSFSDWISNQQTLSDLFLLLQRLAPSSAQRQRIFYQLDDEINQLVILSKSLFCAILTAAHKHSHGRLSDGSPAILDLHEVISPLLGVESTDGIDVFVKTINSYVERSFAAYPTFQRFMRAFCACLQGPLCSKQAVARAWVVWGALQMHCAFPISHLDPTIVNSLKIAIAQDELQRLDADLQLRAAIRSMEVGACGLPCSTHLLVPHTGCVDSKTVQSNVDAGLEHPLVGAIVKRQIKVQDRVQRLRGRQVVEFDNAALNLRETSNSEYSDLRLRLTAFNQNFAGEYLLKLLEQGVGSNLGAIQQWTEAAAALSEWFIQPRRLDLYADVVEPYLLGIVKVMHGLRVLIRLETPQDENVTAFVSLVDALSTGLFPALATSSSVSSACQQRIPLSPSLELARFLISPKIQGILRAFTSPLWNDTKGERDVVSARSIYVDTRDLMAHKHGVSLFLLETEYRLSSHILDLLILDRLSDPAMSPHSVNFISYLLKILTDRLAQRWQRRELRLKRDAERRAALFIEAESRRRKCLDDLQSAATLKSKRASSELRRCRREANEKNALPELVDAGLQEEVEWRLRFSEAGNIEAQQCLTEGISDTLSELHLSRDDAIRQAVHRIENVNSWYEQKLMEGEEASEEEWMPADAELVGFVDRLVFILLRLSHRDWQGAPASVEKHWWRTFLEGYRLAGHLLAYSKYRLPATSDEHSLPSHLLATARLALNARDDTEILDLENAFSFNSLDLRQQAEVPPVACRKRYLDVYRDPIPKAEARKAHSTMVAVRTRVVEVLKEWPDHPALLKIITVLNRMCAFAMSDCLTKYITAFEILLSEIQEWEKNASRHVSLSTIFKSVCDLLVDWRKLELRCWMATLDAATEAAADRCAPLWFHLQHSFLRPTSKTGNLEEEQYQVLLEFMENGPVGEFYPRWRLLSALYGALTVWPNLTDTQRAVTRKIVGNITWFYGQFIPHVQKSLLDQQKPIRKEMKNFISVTKWGDYIGFWTMKGNVDRCKRTIHKHVRAWEGVLRQTVKPYFEAATKISFEVSLSGALLSTIENVGPLKDANPSIFQLSSELRRQLSELSQKRELPLNIRRLPILTKRFKAHMLHIENHAPCLLWIRQLHECLEDWMMRVRELSRSTQRLDSESPPQMALLAVLNEKEGVSQSNKINSKQLDEADIRRAKDWVGLFSALQQSKKLALIDWFRLSLGRRRMVATSRNKKCNDENEWNDDPEAEALEELPNWEVNDAQEQDDVCLGLSYRRGLRKSPFEKSWGSVLSNLGDIRNPSVNPLPASIDQLERLISSSTICNLQEFASESLARLLSLRSGLPRHPENPEHVDDLGGREGVERLLGSLDDLILHCVNAFEPFGKLHSILRKLKDRVEAIHVSYNEVPATGTILPCSNHAMRKLRVSRQRIALLASECAQHWNRFSETCSSLSTPASMNLTRLLAANSEYLPAEMLSCDLSTALSDFRPRLEEIAHRLNQRIPQTCIAITGDILNQQKILSQAADDFLQCCREINLKTCPNTTLFSSLFSVAESISAEVKISGDLITSSTLNLGASTTFQDNVNALISKILISFQNLKQIDEDVEVERGMIDQLSGCAVTLSTKCIAKLAALTSSLERLTPTSTDDIIYLQSLTPLLTSFLYVITLRLRHFLSLLISWLSLGEFLAQVAFRLLNDGFCKPAALSKIRAVGEQSGKEGSSADSLDAGSSNNKDGDGGCTSLTESGVDTSGAKDVSDELQSQEQIEGTMDQQGPTAKDRSQLQPNSTEEGIEMPDDFDGALNEDDERQEKDPEAEYDEEDDFQDIDEQVGEAGDEPDEFNQEMWASNSEEDDTDEEECKNADLNEAGVEDRGVRKSKASKSTAINEKMQQCENPFGEDGGDNEEDKGRDLDTMEPAVSDDTAEAARASGSETVAGDGKETDEGNAAETMKQDEHRLAQQEADAMETEESDEKQNEGMNEEFGENLDIQPNPDEFESVDEPQNHQNELSLEMQPMEVDDSDKNEDLGEIEANGDTDPQGSEPTNEDLISEYHPGVGDLNTGSHGAYDQVSGVDDNRNEAISADTEYLGNDPHGVEEPEEPKDQPSASGFGMEAAQFSTGQPSAPKRGTTSETSYRQRHQGPRPTSDRRTIQHDKLQHQNPIRQTEILEAPEETPSTGDTESEVERKGEAIEHVADETAAASLTAFDSATDAQQKENVGMSENPDDGADPGADPKLQQPKALEHTDPPIEESGVLPSTLNTKSEEKNEEISNSNGTEVRTLPKLDMEVIATLGVQRPPESFFSTPLTIPAIPAADQDDLATPRVELLRRSGNRHDDNADEGQAPAPDTEFTWGTCVERSSALSVQLCEALRLVLEPTRASRMKGDFRTGKRLNMRKIIPYLASQFRKDKIWMRRTQPNQRDYRILIAVDDSSSMADNLCKQMTFEALATVITALNLLEAGKIGICSFGESVEVVHGLGEPWTGEMGAVLLTQFTFKQSRTSLTQLLQTAVALMQAAGEGNIGRRGVAASQLLLILSDGVFSEDPKSPNLQAAVRLARDHQLFIVCIILDDVKKKHSIFDLKRYTGPGRLTPYMDIFPLPFYIVLRDVTALPRLLAEALRQWFELASATAGGGGDPGLSAVTPP